VLGIKAAALAFSPAITHRETANFITSMLTCDCSRLIDPHPIRLRRPLLPSSQEIPLKSNRQLRKIIGDLRELERKCFASRSRFAFYEYLAVVFKLYVQLKRRNQAKTSAQRIAKLFGLRTQNRTHPIRIIIDVTSTGDIKTRSRWSRALRYAWRKRKMWRDLRDFLRENGGPAGCADQFAAINPRERYPGCIVYRRLATGRPYLIVHKGV
jgi:hypothetical protein